MNDTVELQERLETLRSDHRSLDQRIALMMADAPPDQLLLQRLKRQKLALKDQITKIEAQLLPDIIA